MTPEQSWPITATIAQFLRLSGLGNTKTYELIGDGTLITVAVGRRRLVVVESYLRLLERLQATGGDARRNRAMPSLGSTRAKPFQEPKENPPPRDEERRDEPVHEDLPGDAGGSSVRRRDRGVKAVAVRHRGNAGERHGGRRR
jgi:hypothetical protein